MAITDPENILEDDTSERSVSTFGAGFGARGCAAFTEESKSAFAPPFPTVTMSSHGKWEAPDGTDADLLGKLPFGGAPWGPGVLLAYRVQCVSYPTGYEEKSKEKSPPRWSAIVPASDVDDLRLLAHAAKAYTFTPKRDKAKFDAEADGPGHVQIRVELLMFSPELGGPIILRTRSGFQTVERTLNAVNRLADPMDMSLTPKPVLVFIQEEEVTNKSGEYTWKVHHASFDVQMTTAGAEALAAAKKWHEEAASDDDERTKVENWVRGTDEPMTEVIRDDLRSVDDL